MYRLSLSLKTLIIGLVITLFSNSIGYAKEPSIPSASSNCGEWKIEIADSSNDNRIGVTLLQQATGNDCAGTFTLENQTGTSLGGGYSLELTTFSNNANAQFLPYGDPFLIPGLNIEIKTTPIDISQQASITLQGEVTLGSDLAVDFSLFLMKTALDLIPLPTGCLISYDQILLISLRTAPILENTAKLALNGDLIGSKDELSRVIAVFYEKVGDSARDIGIGCFADFLKSILGKPVVIAKIILSYITWIPVVIFDYFKYQGLPTSVTLTYIPPMPPTATPIPFTNINYLIGTWEGEVATKTDAGVNSIVPMTFTITFECNSEDDLPCVNADGGDHPYTYMLPLSSQDGLEYCFGNGGPERYCFTPQEDGTLWANLGTGWVIASGYLHRKSGTIYPVETTPQPSTVTSLVGMWNGNLEIDTGAIQVVETTFGISTECREVNSPCITYDSTHPQNDRLIPFLKQIGLEYCFGIESDLDRYCFEPQKDGTLKTYFQIYTGMREGSIQFAIGKGFLHRKIDDSHTIPTPTPTQSISATETPKLIPSLDRKDPGSVVRAFDYGFSHNDDYPFKLLIDDDKFGVRVGDPCGTGDSIVLSKDKYIIQINDYLAENKVGPSVKGYSLGTSVHPWPLSIITSGWSTSKDHYIVLEFDMNSNGEYALRFQCEDDLDLWRTSWSFIPYP